MEEKANIATETLAELYLKGENVEEAYKIYQQLLAQNPNSVRFKEKVRELEMRLRELEDGSSRAGELPVKPTSEIDRTIGELKDWLNRIRKDRKRST